MDTSKSRVLGSDYRVDVYGSTKLGHFGLIRFIAFEYQIVVYFDQLSGAVRTQKLVETLFFNRFQPFL